MAIVKTNNKSASQKAFALGMIGATALGAVVSTNTVHAATKIANADSVKTTKTQIKKSQVKGLSGKLEQANKDNKTDKQANKDNNDAQQNNNQQATNEHDLEGQAQYTVASGDTLNKIAARANISLDTLLQYNKNINVNNVIHPGDKINLQEQVDPNEAVHTVTKGETLSKIAKDHNVNLDTVYQLNGKSASNTLIHVGDKIKLRDDQNAQNNDQQQAQSQGQQTAATTQQSGSNFTPSALSGTTQQKIVQLAQQLASSGIPYVWGGSTTAGFDCSGLTQYVYRNAAGINLPRTADAQSLTSTAKPVSAAQPGDLLYWGGQGSAYHVAIYIGNGAYVAAPQPGQNVEVEHINGYFMPSGAVTPA